MIPRKFTERPPRGAGAAMFKAAFVTDPQHTVVSVRFELGKVALTTALSATVVGVVARTIPHSHPFFLLGLVTMVVLASFFVFVRCFAFFLSGRYGSLPRGMMERARYVRSLLVGGQAE